MSSPSTYDRCILYNARIWSCAQHTDMTWLTFNSTSGYVTGVGAGDPPLLDYPEQQRIDCNGCRVLPGFHEAHIHVSWLGEQLCAVQLGDCTTVAQVKDKIGLGLQSLQPGSWLTAFGYDPGNLDGCLEKADLDEICGETPALINHVSLHMCLVSSAGLTATGIDENTVCPPGGEIDRNPDGSLTGMLTDAAMTIMKDNMPAPTQARKQLFIETALQFCLEQGVTSVHSNEVGAWKEYCSLAASGKLPIRTFYVPFYANRHKGDFPDYAGVRYDSMLSCDRVKLFTDGALGLQTAALSQPYLGTDNKGLLIYTQEDFDKEVSEAVAQGYRLEMHAIGDAAADIVLNALKTQHVSPEMRPILTHAQILREDQLPAMHAAGIVANIQPSMLNSDTRWLKKILPESLMQYAYAWKSLMNEGIVCAGGSDAPVEPAKPLLGMYDAMFRYAGNRHSADKEVFRASEKLNVHEAIELYTKCGAYATFREKDLGQLRPGYFADFILINSTEDVVDQPEEMLNATVERVYVAGVRKYTREAEQTIRPVISGPCKCAEQVL